MNLGFDPDIAIEFRHEEKRPPWDNTPTRDDIYLLAAGPTRIKQVFRHILWPILKPVTHNAVSTKKVIDALLDPESNKYNLSIPEGYTVQSVSEDDFRSIETNHRLAAYDIHLYQYHDITITHQKGNCVLCPDKYVPTRNDMLNAVEELHSNIEQADDPLPHSDQETTIEDFC